MEEIKIFSGRSHPELARKICRKLGISLSSLKTEKHENNCIEVILEDDVQDKLVFLVQTSLPTNNLHRDIWEFLEMAGAASKSGAKEVVAVMPYVSYARSDKDYAPGMAISGELLAWYLEKSGITRFIGIDFHSPAFENFFSEKTKVYGLRAKPLIVKELMKKNLENTILLPGDKGALEKANFLGEQLGIPVVYVKKKKINDAKVRIKIRKEDEEKVAGKDIFIFDDESSTGTTIAELIKKAKELKANKSFIITLIHGPFTKKAVKTLQGIRGLKEIIVTDTVPIPKKIRKSLPLTVISTAGLLAETIKKISEECLKET